MRQLFLLLMVFSLPSWSLYLGNPSLPDDLDEGLFLDKEAWFGFKAGYEWDYVFDRNLLTSHHKKIDQFQSLSNQGVLTFNLQDRYEIYGSLGGFKAFFSRRPNSTERYEYQSKDDLLWGVGGRALIFRWENTSMGADFKYEYAHPRISYILLNGAPQSLTRVPSLQYKEWQLGLALSHKIDIFLPYIGVKYARVRAHVKKLPEEETSFSMQNKDKFGMVVGTTMTTGRIFDLTAEFRMFDEQALTMSSVIRF